MEKKTKNDERYFETLFSMPAAVITADVDGVITYMNPAAEGLTGWHHEEALGQHVETVFKLTGREADRIKHLTTKNGEQKPVVCTSNDIKSRTGEQIGRTLLIQEPSEPGLDLRTDLSQYLGSMSILTKMMTQKLTNKSLKEADESAMLGHLIEHAKQHLVGLTAGVGSVEPLKDSLIQALKELIDNTEKKHRIPCTFRWRGPLVVHKPEVAMELYRIVQEGVHCGVEHAEPTQIAVDLDCKDSGTVLSISYDGIEFPMAASSAQEICLQTLTYRAKKIDAKLDIERAPKGVVIVCSIQGLETSKLDDEQDIQAKSGGATKRKILIVHDYPIIRCGLKHVIDQENDLTVVSETQEAYQTMEAIADSHPDLVIVDMCLKDVSGLELIKSIQTNFEVLPILVLSVYDEALFAERALRAGARGYLMRHEGPSEVVVAIRKVLAGEIYVNDEMKSAILHKSVNGRFDGSCDDIDKLSDRELEVFQLIGLGRTGIEIAEVLHLSVNTVDTHRAHIKQKLNLKNGTELLQYAIQWRLGQNAN